MTLSKIEYESHAPDTVGEQVRVNHVSSYCSGTSNSMTVKRTAEGIFAYCYRCGNTGATKEKTRSIARPKARVKNVTLPHDISDEPMFWPARVKVWLMEQHIDLTSASGYGIMYSDSLRRVIIPVYQPTGGLVGYQARHIFPEDTGPKYYTVTSDPERMFHYAPYNRYSTVFVVEDFISMLRIRSLGFGGTAILGTTASNVWLHAITNLPVDYNIVILLDWDNPTVIRKTIALQRKLLLHFNKVHVVTEEIDVKGMDDLELNMSLYRYI